jgi:SNF2 family DNA or RNA helicase
MLELDADQVADVERMLSGNYRFGLFHEMGVGKTPPAIKAASQRLPALLTVPAYLMPQWEKRINEWVPGATVSCVNGDGHANRTAQLTIGADFTLVSYNLWAPGKDRPQYPALHKQRWGSLTLDEGHRIRGHGSQWTKAIWAWDNADSKNRGKPIWDLTGTPHVRDGGDLYPFLHLCDRQLYSSYWSFVERHCFIEETPWERVIGKLRDKHAFYEILARYSTRRILTGVDDVIEDVVPVQLPASVYAAIKKMKKDFVLEHPDMADPEFFDAAGAIVSRARQLVTVPPTAAKPKLDAMVGIVEDLPKDRVIVFCWFRDSAKAAFDRLSKMKSALTGKPRPVVMFTGDTRVSAKIAAIDTYNKYEDAIIVATIAALKEGADLQAGNHSIFLEEDWLSEVNAQAIGRQRRRGQDKPVVVHRILADRSVDHMVAKAASGRGDDIRGLMQEYVRGGGYE